MSFTYLFTYLLFNCNKYKPFVDNRSSCLLCLRWTIFCIFGGLFGLGYSVEMVTMLDKRRQCQHLLLHLSLHIDIYHYWMDGPGFSKPVRPFGLESTEGSRQLWQNSHSDHYFVDRLIFTGTRQYRPMVDKWPLCELGLCGRPSVSLLIPIGGGCQSPRMHTGCKSADFRHQAIQENCLFSTEEQSQGWMGIARCCCDSNLPQSTWQGNDRIRASFTQWCF